MSRPQPSFPELAHIYESIASWADDTQPKFYPIVQRPSLLCRIGLHRPLYLSAEGVVGLLTSIERRACPCGRWEWVYMDGRRMGRQASHPRSAA